MFTSFMQKETVRKTRLLCRQHWRHASVYAFAWVEHTLKADNTMEKWMNVVWCAHKIIDSATLEDVSLWLQSQMTKYYIQFVRQTRISDSTTCFSTCRSFSSFNWRRELWLYFSYRILWNFLVHMNRCDPMISFFVPLTKYREMSMRCDTTKSNRLRNQFMICDHHS